MTIIRIIITWNVFLLFIEYNEMNICHGTQYIHTRTIALLFVPFHNLQRNVHTCKCTINCITYCVYTYNTLYLRIIVRALSEI